VTFTGVQEVKNCDSGLGTFHRGKPDVVAAELPGTMIFTTWAKSMKGRKESLARSTRDD
jgi:hypothetical protein